MTAEDQAPPAHACTCDRPRPPEFWPRLHHRTITARINGAPSISGTLEAFSIYEIVIRTAAGKAVMVPKHAITSVDLPPDWRRSPGPEAEASAEGGAP